MTLAYLLFVDESGHDRVVSPYEVLAGVAVEDRDVWNLIRALNELEERVLGLRYTRLQEEIKGSKFLKRKVFRHATQLDAIDADERRALAKQCLENGAGATRESLTALAQAKLYFVEQAFLLCASFRCKVFACIVDSKAPRSESSFLRKDYAYLFERFYYFLEDKSDTPQGIVVFDELEKSASKLLLGQMEEYFQNTQNGRIRSNQIVPEPFFVHSDLSTLIQIADLAAYSLSWGFRLPMMTKECRGELDIFTQLLANIRFSTKRDIQGENYTIWGFTYIDDLRGVVER